MDLVCTSPCALNEAIPFPWVLPPCPPACEPLPPEPTAPAAFSEGDWTLVDAATGGDATLTINTLPSDGGSPITALEYSIDGGPWIALVGTGTGARTIGGFTNGVAANVTIRAVNAEGTGAVGPSKAVTTTGV